MHIPFTKKTGWRGKLGEAALLLIIVAAGFVIIEVFLIGLIFLFMPRTPMNSGTCDEVQQYGTQWQCIVNLKGPGDTITVIRGAIEP